MTPEIDWTRYAIPVGDGMVERAMKRIGGSDEMEFVASTAGEASDGDIVSQDSWLLATFRSNPVVLYEHQIPVIGTARVSQGQRGDDLHAWITFDEGDENPTGRLAASQHRAGIRSAVSVRWRPGKITPRNELDKSHPAYDEGREVETWWGGKTKVVGRLHEKNTLVEISSVALPADPRALQIRGAFGMTGEQIRSALATGHARTMRDDLIDLLRDDPEIRGLLRSLSIAAPPPRESPQNEAIRAALLDLHAHLAQRTTS